MTARTTLSHACLLTLFGLSGMCAAQESHSPHWSYSGAEDPVHWGALGPEYATCSSGHVQSPIDITHATPADLPALAFNYKATDASVINNGHTIQINVPAGSSLIVGGKTYELKQFHFHHPSEEHVDGRGFPLVAHLVHQDSSGHLAVVAILFEEGGANALVDTLWRNIPAGTGTARVLPANIQLMQILPADRGYFTYAGSLTTPPCTEGVTWYVLKQHATVSAPQIATFARLYPSDARPIQPTNGREIVQSK